MGTTGWKIDSFTSVSLQSTRIDLKSWFQIRPVYLSPEQLYIHHTFRYLDLPQWSTMSICLFSSPGSWLGFLYRRKSLVLLYLLVRSLFLFTSHSTLLWFSCHWVFYFFFFHTPLHQLIKFTSTLLFILLLKFFTDFYYSTHTVTTWTVLFEVLSLSFFFGLTSSVFSFIYSLDQRSLSVVLPLEKLWYFVWCKISTSQNVTDI